MKKKKKKKIPVRLPTAPPSIKHKDAKKYDRKRDKKNFPMESLSIKSFFLETKHARDRSSERNAQISNREIENIQMGLDRLSAAIVRAGRKPSDFFEVEKAYVIPRGRGMIVIALPDRGHTKYPTLRIMTVLGPGQKPLNGYEMFMPVAERVKQELSGLKGR